MGEMLVWDDVREHVGLHVREVFARIESVLLERERVRVAAEEEAAAQAVGVEIPQGLLVKERLHVRVRIDPLLESAYDSAAYEAHVRERVVLEMQHYGSDRGFDIHPESVLISVEDDGYFGRAFHGEWCPDPTKGCDFRGGPFDGETRPMGRGPYGFPERHWVLPIEQDSRDFLLPSYLEPVQSVTYRLAGIDSMRDRWVYECRG
jgi:hypothetical protein